MGHSPSKRRKKNSQVQSTTQTNHRILVGHGCSSHMLISTSWWSSQKREPHSITHNKQQKGKLEPKQFYHAIKYAFTVKYTYITQACYDLSIKYTKTRLDSSGYILRPFNQIH